VTRPAPLTDVWRNIQQDISVYYRGRGDAIPSVPGVYAWFYPLYISRDQTLDAVLKELKAVHLYDASAEGRPHPLAAAYFGWSEIQLEAKVVDRPLPDPSESWYLREIWDEAREDDTKFDQLERSLLRASILLPPLYIGKTKDLAIRYNDHITDTRDNKFHSRFVSHAKKQGLRQKEVRDLLFVTLRTDDMAHDVEEDLVEGILNLVARPPYGKR
jgi:hypothetical protein